MLKLRSGFTLVELLLVVVLLAVIAGLSIPRFSQTYKKMQLKQSAENLAYVMRYAQSRSITGNQFVRLLFSSERDRYWIEEQEENENFELEYKRINGRMGQSYAVPDNFNIDFNGDAIEFNPDGSIEKKFLYICVNENDQCYTVSTAEQRGMVHVFDFKLEKE